MPNLTVVTSFSPEGWELYGRKFFETFREHWPLEAKLICYWEGEQPEGVEGFDLLELEPAASFLERHVSSEEVRGKREGCSPWGGKAKRLGYSLRHDAYKFARKVFAICHAAREVEVGKLFWVDADVVTNRRIPEGMLAGLLPKNVSLAYLSRAKFNYPSELGFVGYNLDSLETHAFLTAYENRYAGDHFLKDAAWDDCSQFDRLIEKFAPHAKLILHSSMAQPFDQSILGNYMRHNKGKRKAA